MAKPRARKVKAPKYVLPLFIVTASLVFAVLFTILITPAVLTKFGFEPILLLLLVASGVTSATLSILFYLILKKEIKF